MAHESGEIGYWDGAFHTEERHARDDLMWTTLQAQRWLGGAVVHYEE